mgnify:CR=1 FL=1
MNRSPSTASSKVPPWSSVRLRAMDSPRPEPSVFLDLSPRTKRSVSSSGPMFNGFVEIFLMGKVTMSMSSPSSPAVFSPTNYT